MTQMDSGRERERLRQLYAGMHDGELEKIAGDADSLTSVARAALRVEMLGRGLNAPLEANPERDPVKKEPDLPGPVIVGRYQNEPAAWMAKSILDSAGIEAFLNDDNVIRMAWHYSNAVGGIKLLVREEDAEAATKLLEQSVLEDFEVAGRGTYQQPKCPKCQSMDVSLNELDKRLAYSWFLLGIPVAVNRKGWNCHSCGHEWKEEEEAPALPSVDSRSQDE